MGPFDPSRDPICFMRDGQSAEGALKRWRGMVQVDSLRFTQASCAARFRGGPYAGRTLEDAVKDLISGRLKHHQESWFMLDAVKKTRGTVVGRQSAPLLFEDD